jgi:glutamyl-tRNA reductase
MDNVYVYDIDDLQKIIDDNLVRRSTEAVRAEAIVREETSEFIRWLTAHRSGLATGLKHLRS